jgi:hypothetical protein
VHREFAQLTKAEPRIERELIVFLTAAYQFKQRADCAIGPTAPLITVAKATAALATAARFIDTITQLPRRDRRDLAAVLSLRNGRLYRGVAITLAAV